MESITHYTMRIFILTFFLTACSLIEYHPYEIRLDESERDLNAKAMAELSNQYEKDTITFILFGDTQRFYDETEDFVRSANQQDVDFVILAGDLSDFGLLKEQQWINRSLSGLKVPRLSVIGNHDLTGNGERVFKEMYGPLDYSLVISNIKFIFLNTNSREYQFDGRVPDLTWLESELNGQGFQQAIVVSHIAPFSMDFDPEKEEDYASILSESQKVRLSLHAHSHSFSHSRPYGDDVQYFITTSAAERQYLVFKVFGERYLMELVPF
jgi:predicted phosphodiesterase